MELFLGTGSTVALRGKRRDTDDEAVRNKIRPMGRFSFLLTREIERGGKIRFAVIGPTGSR